MISPAQAEARLRELDVMQSGEFITAAGLPANLKVEMSVMYNDRQLLLDIGEEHAHQLEPYKPEVIVPVPNGANQLAQVIGAIMGVPCVIIKWTDKENRKLGYLDEITEAKVTNATSVALIEDVSSTDGTMVTVADFLGTEKEYVGSVTWDRFPESPKKSDFPVMRFINRYVPLRVE